MMPYRESSAKYWVILILMLVCASIGGTLYVSRLQANYDEQSIRVGALERERDAQKARADELDRRLARLAPTPNAQARLDGDSAGDAVQPTQPIVQAAVLIAVVTLGVGGNVIQVLRWRAEREALHSIVRRLHDRLEMQAARMVELRLRSQLVWRDEAERQL